MSFIIENSNVVDFKLKWSSCEIGKCNAERGNFAKLTCILSVLYTTLGRQKEL